MRKLYIILIFITFSFQGLTQDATAKQLDSLLNIVWELRNSSPQKALQVCQQAITLAEESNHYEHLAKAYSFMGVLYRNLGYYSIAFSYYSRALNIARKYHINDQLAYSYNNLGNIFLYQNLPRKAIIYLKRADSLGKVLNNPDIRAYALQNIGRSYIALNQADSAIFYLRQAMLLRQKAGIKNKLPVTYKYLADAYKLAGDFKNAKKYYDLTARTADFEKDLDLYADYTYQLADFYLKTGQTDSALYYAKESIKAAEQVGSLYRIFMANDITAKIYAKTGDYKKAYEYSQKALELKDKIFTEEVIKGIKSIEFTEEAIRKEAAIQLLEKDLRIKELEAKRKTLYLNIVILVGVIFLVFLTIIFFNYLKIKKISRRLEENNKIIRQQNIELQEQKEKLSSQTELLQKINDELRNKERIIVQSINYAKNILIALMGDEKILSTFPFVKDYFLINKPKEIIGGDFYYFNKFEKFYAVIIADSTGHGVPGAFISIISISLLKDILFGKENRIVTAAGILEEFREKIKGILRQDQQNIIVKDGVDLSLCLFYPDLDRMDYAGAYNPAYLIDKQKNLVILQGTKSTAGYSLKEFKFENHTVKLSDYQKIYLFTDGIVDQLDPVGHKFTSTRWKKMIAEISDLPMDEQKQMILEALSHWKREKAQTDDILILGLELNNQDTDNQD